MAFVTLEVGPSWKMQVLCGVLTARGLPALVEDDSLSAYFGAGRSTARLEVPEEFAEPARTVLGEAKRDGSSALEKLRFGLHERFSPPRPLRSMLLDVAFWGTLLLVAIWVISLLLH